MNALESESPPAWEQIRPLLDEALDQLGPADRVAALNPAPTRAPARSSGTSAELERSRNEFFAFTETAAYRNADQLAKAVQTYLRQHQGQVPGDLAMLESPGHAPFAEGTSQRFELVRTGTVVENSNLAPYLLIAHEKEPSQLPDGKWVRLYLQANGGLTTMGPLPNKPPLDDSGFIRQQEELGKQKTQANR